MWMIRANPVDGLWTDNYFDRADRAIVAAAAMLMPLRADFRLNGPARSLQ
jgi:hypothetical protein